MNVLKFPGASYFSPAQRNGEFDAGVAFAGLNAVSTKYPLIFRFKDTTIDDSGWVYRTYSYGIYGESDPDMWKFPFAVDHRGTIMRYHQETGEVVLAYYFTPKFFNFGESNAAIKELPDVVPTVEKMDGSVIGVFRDHNGNIQFKSNRSFSDNASCVPNCRNWFKAKPERWELIEQSIPFDGSGNAVCLTFEWCSDSAHETIVVRHPEAFAAILGCYTHAHGFSMVTSLTLDSEVLKSHYGVHVPRFEWMGRDVLLDRLQSMVDCEGVFVLDWAIGGYNLPDRLDLVALMHSIPAVSAVKMKTAWYSKLHRLIDSISNPKLILEAVRDGTLDDLDGSVGRNAILDDGTVTHVGKRYQLLREYTVNILDHHVMRLSSAVELASSIVRDSKEFNLPRKVAFSRIKDQCFLNEMDGEFEALTNQAFGMLFDGAALFDVYQNMFTNTVLKRLIAHQTKYNLSAPQFSEWAADYFKNETSN